MPDGESLIDDCEVCDNDSTNNCTQDCTGAWGGSALEDQCGKCNGLNSKVNCVGSNWDDNCDWMDCGGVCNPDSSILGNNLDANTGSYGGVYQMYWKDCDSDGFGSVYIGRVCSKVVNGTVSKDNPDFEESCGLCLDTDGEIAPFDIISACTAAGNTWTNQGTLVANNNDYDDSCYCTANDETCFNLCDRCSCR